MKGKLQGYLKRLKAVKYSLGICNKGIKDLSEQ